MLVQSALLLRCSRHAEQMVDVFQVVKAFHLQNRDFITELVSQMCSVR